MIYVVGIGPGNKDYILPKALETLKKSNIILGFSRAINSLDFIKIEKKYVNSLKEIIQYIENKKEEMIISIVASGDPTFYGIGEYIKKNYRGNIEVIPGISSFQYLTSKLGKGWSNAYVGSLHGREGDFINRVNENTLSIWLTDTRNNPKVLCEMLVNNKINCKVVVGENLSYNDERILEGNPVNLLNEEYSDLSIFLVERIN